MSDIISPPVDVFGGRTYGDQAGVLVEPGQAVRARQAVEMDPEIVRQRCLAKPGAGEDFPFGEGVSVFKVAGKIFAIAALGGDAPEVSLKCEPELAQALRAQHPAVRPGYHLNKRHWNTVTLDGSLTDAEIAAMIDDSYELIVDALPRKIRQTLPGPSS